MSWLDPLHGIGYQFWSGVGSGSPLFIVAYTLLRKHNCYHRGCPRIGLKLGADGHHRCRKHHDEKG